MGERSCKYFLLVAHVLDHPDAHDHHIARFARLVKKSYEASGARYAPLRIGNRALGKLWRCNESATRACLTDLKRFGWIDTRQIGQHEREIIILAAWRNDGTDDAVDTNAATTSDLHLAAQATAPLLPARHAALTNQGAIQSRTLSQIPNVVVGTISNLNQENIYQQQHTFNPGCTVDEGAIQDRTLNEGEKQTPTLRSKDDEARIVDALWDLDLRDSRVVDAILGRIPEMFRGQPLDFSHITPEYVEDWVLHRRLEAKRRPGGLFGEAGDLLGDGDAFEYALGAGYYRMQIREKRESPYHMSDKQRAAYRARWDAWREEEAGRADEPEEPAALDDDALSLEANVNDSAELPDRASPCGDAESEPPRYRQDGTSAIWSAALDELKLQMTKAVFDTWLGGARALGWDGEQDKTLVVGVHSLYAKDWLENRLNAKVQSTVTGIVGHAVAVRYEVAERGKIVTARGDGSQHGSEHA